MLNIREYTYDLPNERIALYPISNRDESKLLVYSKGNIIHDNFLSLDGYLPDNSFLFFNNTKVIPARLIFKKETGATIEIFLLNPVHPSHVISQAMEQTSEVTWKCTIGNIKRWTDGLELTMTVGDSSLHAMLQNREEGIVRFTWNGNISFAEIIERSGNTPLPPYLKRNAEDTDKTRYQTIYSSNPGAVAAPTAGLHFTERIFNNLQHKKIAHDYLTLHVSAGTFQPVKTENADEHVMHAEQVVISRQNIQNLLTDDRFIIAVGTTSMRTLESLYWFGIKLENNPDAIFSVGQNEPYLLNEKSISTKTAIENIYQYMTRNDLQDLIGETSIFIKPGYKFRVCKGLITNFHQPGSTLILLVASFIGNDWKRIYKEALDNQYRFLSYGDSSLLLPQE